MECHHWLEFSHLFKWVQKPKQLGTIFVNDFLFRQLWNLLNHFLSDIERKSQKKLKHFLRLSCKKNADGNSATFRYLHFTGGKKGIFFFFWKKETFFDTEKLSRRLPCRSMWEKNRMNCDKILRRKMKNIFFWKLNFFLHLCSRASTWKVT